MRLRHLMILFLGILPIAAQVKGNPPAEVLYAKCKASVVTILTFDAKRVPLGQGSGFIVAKNRVVTNYHVVVGSASASIIFDDGSIAVVTAVVAGSGPKDLVIVEAETGNRPALGLGDELQLKVGETIYAIGTPNGLSTSLSNGLVSAFRQDAGQFLIQISARIAPGTYASSCGDARSREKDKGLSVPDSLNELTERQLDVFGSHRARLTLPSGEMKTTTPHGRMHEEGRAERQHEQPLEIDVAAIHDIEGPREKSLASPPPSCKTAASVSQWEQVMCNTCSKYLWPSSSGHRRLPPAEARALYYRCRPGQPTGRGTTRTEPQPNAGTLVAYGTDCDR